MSCKNKMGACCDEATLVVDRYCVNFRKGAALIYSTVYSDEIAQPMDIFVHVYPDSPGAPTPTMTVVLSTGNVIIPLIRGQSITVSYPNVLSIQIQDATGEVLTIGYACFTVYRKFY